MIAALYVDRDGPYYGVPGIDPWDRERDARKYAGRHRVVAHPPCSAWGQMAPVNEARYGHKIGDDGGCFAAALEAVRTWGGVLEHPAYSLAWAAHHLPRPDPWGGWQGSLMCGGWVAHVEQRNYGHRARKATWLYCHGVNPPPLIWGPGPEPEAWISADRPRAELAALGIDQLSKAEARRTPEAFRDALIAIATAEAAQ